MVTQDAFLTLFDERQPLSQELIDRLRVSNPIQLVMHQLDSSLSLLITSTTAVSYERSVAVPTYPLESGLQVSDHVSPESVIVRMSGLVSAYEGGGTGPTAVANRFNQAIDDSDVFDVHTGRGAFDDCVVRRFNWSQNSSNSTALEFDVVFSQTTTGTVVSAPSFDPVITNQPGNSNAELLSPDQISQLAVETGTAAQYEEFVDPADVSQIAVEAATRSNYAVPLSLDAKRFVVGQLKSLAEDGLERPEYPPSFAREVAMLDDERYALQFGSQAPEGIPLAGISFLRVTLSNNPVGTWSGSLGGISVSAKFKYRARADNQGWYADISVSVPRTGNVSLATVFAGDRKFRYEGVQLHSGVPVRIGNGVAALIPIPLGSVNETLNHREPWGRTHDMIFVNDVSFINAQ